MRNRVNILGLDVDNVTLDDSVCVLEDFIASGRSHLVCTPNVDHIVQADHDEEFKAIINSADLSIPDGKPLVWISRLLRKPLKERVAGIDLFYSFCRRANEKGYRVYLLGSTPETLDKAIRKLRGEFPHISIVGFESPGIISSHDDASAILSRINAAKPDALFVALGAPKQEKWIYKNLQNLKVPVCVGVGSSFELIAGVIKRAPLWMQRMGLEWFYKLMQKPGRYYKRYLLKDIKIIKLFFRRYRYMKRSYDETPNKEIVR